MEITLLINLLVGLIVILGVLMFLLFYLAKSKKKAQKTTKNSLNVEKELGIDLDVKTLLAVIKNKKTTSKELKSTLDLILEHHGIINKSDKKKMSSDFDIYMEILFSICHHPNTDKNIIIHFDRELKKQNPAYKTEIDDTITNALNSRTS